MSETLREAVARLCHEQWVHWMKYLYRQTCTESDGTRTIPEQDSMRWQRQIMTDYANLSEDEKNSDRREADKFLAILPGYAALEQQVKELQEALGLLLGPIDDPKCGWRGYGKERHLYYCEYCEASYQDFTLISHKESCPVVMGRKALAPEPQPDAGPGKEG